MALRKEKPGSAPKRKSKVYSSEKIPVVNSRNSAIGEIEAALGGQCEFDSPSHRPTGRRGGGHSPIYRTCSATMYSGEDEDAREVTMTVRGKYFPEGVIFSGMAELKLTYEEGVDQGDLKRVEDAIKGAGLKKGKIKHVTFDSFS